MKGGAQLFFWTEMKQISLTWNLNMKQNYSKNNYG